MANLLHGYTRIKSAIDLASALQNGKRVGLRFRTNPQGHTAAETLERLGRQFPALMSSEDAVKLGRARRNRDYVVDIQAGDIPVEILQELVSRGFWGGIYECGVKDSARDLSHVEA